MIDRSLQQPFDEQKWYGVDGTWMERLRKAVLSLYAENAMSHPDAQRDMAQHLAFVVQEAVELEDD